MPRTLRVSITIMDGEHRIHVGGESAELYELSGLADFKISVFNNHQAPSKAEAYRSVLNSWRRASTTSSAAAKAHGPFSRALEDHRRRHPNCKIPYSDPA